MLSITRSGRRRIMRLSLMILCFGLLSACTVSLVAPYDQKTDQRLDIFSRSANTLLYQLEEQNAKQPVCRYENHAGAYRSLKVQLQTMTMHEQAKPDNTQTQDQISALQQRLDLFITDHKRVCPPAVAVQVAQKQINQMLGHILKLERSKRRDK